MFLNNKYLLNEGYGNKNQLFTSGHGSHIYIGKKKYIDLSLCAGSNLLGHSSRIFKETIAKISKNNISNFAASNLYAQKYSNTLKKIFPNYSKFIFCNSGTEAVFKSLRIARAVTKKNLIICVSGSWHGSVNELLFTTNSKLKNISLSEGLESHSKKNIKFIPYNNILLSKKILEKYQKKIMCVILEPVQGCLPLLAKDYLNFLNNFCKQKKIILIFDEMITGLRINGKSIQHSLNLQPSISTFGKCLGGGMPIGIIGINKEIENKIIKKNKKIFFGGTFSGNSINTFIANEMVKFVLKNTKYIFKDLEKKSKYFQDKLNDFFIKKNLDAKCLRVSSMLRIIFTKKKIINRAQRDFLERKNLKKIKMFRKILFSQNIFYPTNGIIFFSNSITFKNIDTITNKIKLAFNKIFK